MANELETLTFLDYLEEFYGKTYNEQQREMLDLILQDAPAEHLQSVRESLCINQKWLPRPAEIKEAVLAAQGDRDPYHPRASYWQAMDLFNACLAGEIDDRSLETDRSWQLYKRLAAVHRPGCPCRLCAGDDPAELERLAAELTRQDMEVG
jgi:hypothetical protein